MCGGNCTENLSAVVLEVFVYHCCMDMKVCHSFQNLIFIESVELHLIPLIFLKVTSHVLIKRKLKGLSCSWVSTVCLHLELLGKMCLNYVVRMCISCTPCCILNSSNYKYT
jgi:hypothetical protein